MAIRADINEGVQFGLETLAAPGTPVAANFRPLVLKFQPNPKTPNSVWSPMGAKVPTDVLMEKEWAECTFADAPLSYYDMAYLYASLLCAPTKSTPGGATNARALTYLPLTYGQDQKRTFTFQKGQSAGTEAASFVQLNSINHTFNNTGGRWTGDAIGRKLIDNGDLTAIPTALCKKPVPPKGVRVEVGTAVNALTKLTKAPSSTFNVGGRATAFFSLDDAQESFVDTVEVATTAAASIVIVNDNTAISFMDNLRLQDTRFCRITCFGPEVEAGQKHQIRITFPFRFMENVRQPTNGAYTGTFNIQPIHNEAFGGWLEVMIVNGMSDDDIDSLKFDGSFNPWPALQQPTA